MTKRYRKENTSRCIARSNTAVYTQSDRTIPSIRFRHHEGNGRRHQGKGGSERYRASSQWLRFRLLGIQLIKAIVRLQDLQGRKIRVDFSMTQKPHEPTPGEYMGPKRPDRDDRDRRGGGGGYDRGGYGGGSSRGRYDSDRGDRGDRGGYRGGSRYYSSNRDSSRSPPPARRRSHSPGAGRRDSPSYDRS